MCGIVFELAKGRGRTVNRLSVYVKGVMRNFAEFSRNHLYRNSFVVFSCEFCKICKNTFFCITATDHCL